MMVGDLLRFQRKMNGDQSPQNNLLLRPRHGDKSLPRNLLPQMKAGEIAQILVLQIVHGEGEDLQLHQVALGAPLGEVVIVEVINQEEKAALNVVKKVISQESALSLVEVVAEAVVAEAEAEEVAIEHVLNVVKKDISQEDAGSASVEDIDNQITEAYKQDENSENTVPKFVRNTSTPTIPKKKVFEQ
jgi:hypothetical protein